MEPEQGDAHRDIHPQGGQGTEWVGLVPATARGDTRGR
jgi:hypothetical protein